MPHRVHQHHGRSALAGPHATLTQAVHIPTHTGVHTHGSRACWDSPWHALWWVVGWEERQPGPTGWALAHLACDRGPMVGFPGLHVRCRRLGLGTSLCFLNPLNAPNTVTLWADRGFAGAVQPSALSCPCCPGRGHRGQGSLHHSASSPGLPLPCLGASCTLCNVWRQSRRGTHLHPHSTHTCTLYTLASPHTRTTHSAHTSTPHTCTHTPHTHAHTHALCTHTPRARAHTGTPHTCTHTPHTCTTHSAHTPRARTHRHASSVAPPVRPHITRARSQAHITHSHSASDMRCA